MTWLLDLLMASGGVPVTWAAWEHSAGSSRRAFALAVIALPLHAPPIIFMFATGSPLAALPFVVGAAVAAYIAWRNRPRKHCLADKVTGVVRNVGHRLKVVAVPATQGGRS